MGILDKVKFWKKDDLGLGDLGGLPGGDQFEGLNTEVPADPNLGQGAVPAQDPRFPPQPQSFQSQQQYQSQNYPQSSAGNNSNEVISAKLDALKANLESINQRLANIERIAMAEEQQQNRRQW